MTALQIGDEVITTYNGKPSRHVITHARSERNCQSGLMFRVSPPLRAWRDRSNPFDEWPEEFYDAGWFAKIDSDTKKEQM